MIISKKNSFVRKKSAHNIHSLYRFISTLQDFIGIITKTKSVIPHAFLPLGSISWPTLVATPSKCGVKKGMYMCGMGFSPTKAGK